MDGSKSKLINNCLVNHNCNRQQNGMCVRGGGGGGGGGMQDKKYENIPMIL